MRSTVIAFVAVLVGFGTAAAAPKVAMPAIEGDDNGSVREAVTEALDGKDLSIVGTKETNKVVDKLKIEPADLTEKQAKKLQTELEADAVVLGSLGKDKESGTKSLKFKLFVNGKKAKGFSLQFSNPKSKKFKETLHKTMVEKLSVAGVDEGKAKDKDDDKPKAAKKDKDKDKDDDKPKAKKKDKKDKDKDDVADDDKPKAKKKDKKDKDDDVADDDKPKAKKKKKTADKDADADADEPKKKKKKKKKPEPKADGEPDEGDPKPEKKTAKIGDDDGDDADGTITVRVAPKRTANTNAARVDVGISASARTLTFTFTPELVGTGRGAPAPFKPGPVPGARVAGDVYPLAFGDPKSFAAGLGIAFDFDQVLSSKVQTTAEPGSIGKVKQQHYMIGARYRLALGKTPTSPTISVGAGYGRRTFVVKSGLMDRAALDLPDTDYKFIAPFLGARFPITANIAVLAQGDAMLVSNAGPISKGDSYGRAKVFGFEAAGGLDIVLGNRFAIRLMFEMTQIGFAFTGGGNEANNRDGDATTIDIGGALDRSIGGVGTLAFTY